MAEVSETGSTNADLLEAAKKGAPGRLVLRADHQTAGRGRLDRTWEAPPGVNLLVSLLFRAGDPTVRFAEGSLAPHDLVHAVALAALRTGRDTYGAPVVIKWPNDLLIGVEKVAGILAQAGTSEDGDFVVVGIGVNLGWAPPGATSLSAHSSRDQLDVTPHSFCLHMLDVLEEILGCDAPQLHDAYINEVATIGARVKVETHDQMIEGRALAVEPDGRLVVLDECGITHRFATADVVHLRPQSG